MPGEKQAEKPTTQERLKQITDKIEAGIRDLFASDQYRAYLSTMTRFHQYSFNNSVLIYRIFMNITCCGNIKSCFFDDNISFFHFMIFITY